MFEQTSLTIPLTPRDDVPLRNAIALWVAMIQRRIELFCALLFQSLDRLILEALTREIGTKGNDEAGEVGAL
jgi:hypothetical protein